ncbi:hypothetical protein A3Q56_05100 [Intoshia linei]|uniref:Isocitric dehydrogenase subunit beta n=1 Tax=Intoshia linei TaxID=1819745 RepID=A0A177B0L5_9BILA|nr:hypothetical protein A3Q56_05100 [Intoshia linei]
MLKLLSKLKRSGFYRHLNQQSMSTATKIVTMIPGDGVGPELMLSVKDVFKSISVPVTFEEHFVSEVQFGQSEPLEDIFETCNRNKFCLKGIISSPINSEHGFSATLNMRLRKILDLFANIVRVKSLEGFNSKHQNLDLVIIREQLEGEYSCLEHEVAPGIVECLKIITKERSNRIAKFAFDYAKNHKREKVTVVHKANIMKLSDGLFLDCCEKMSLNYPEVKFESMIIDNTCMQMVSNPHQFDVMVMPNLYGNILDNLAAGLVGGPSVVPGESHGEICKVYEPGARNSLMSDAGRNVTNPTAIILCASKMLHDMGFTEEAKIIYTNLLDLIRERKVKTQDMGGYATRTDFTNALIKKMTA